MATQDNVCPFLGLWEKAQCLNTKDIYLQSKFRVLVRAELGYIHYFILLFSLDSATWL